MTSFIHCEIHFFSLILFNIIEKVYVSNFNGVIFKNEI